MDELHLSDPDHNPTSSKLLVERSVAKESEPCSTEMEQSSIEETHEKQFEIQANLVYNNSEEVVLIEERKWNVMLSCKHFGGHPFEAEISKLVMRLVRHYDQDGAVHGNSMGPKLRRRLEGKNYRTQIGFNTFMKETTRRCSSVARIPKHVLLYIRAIQGHTGGNLIAPELMGHVAIPYKWKKFLFI